MNDFTETEEMRPFAVLIALAKFILVIWLLIANYFLCEYLFEFGDGYFREIILPIMITLTMTVTELITYTACTKKLQIKIYVTD